MIELGIGDRSPEAASHSVRVNTVFKSRRRAAQGDGDGVIWLGLKTACHVVYTGGGSAGLGVPAALLTGLLGRQQSLAWFLSLSNRGVAGILPR